MFAISFALHSPLTPATWDVEHIILQLCGVFSKERHCKSSIRNSQDAIFMQIALCAKLRNLRTTENIGNVGRMHLKCKSFLGVVNSSLRSLLPAPFSSFSLWLLGEKKNLNNYQTEKIVWSCCAEEQLSRSDNGAERRSAVRLAGFDENRDDNNAPILFLVPELKVRGYPVF